MTNSGERRVAHFDGLRGIAALMVFLNHLVLAVLPAASTLSPAEAHGRIDVWLGYSPVSVLWGGDFAVCIFFVISGYVLADYATRTQESFIAQVARRYARLTLPIIAISSLALVLLVFGLYYNKEGSLISKSSWIGVWYQSPASLTGFLKEMLYGAYKTGASYYNSNLWTMHYELIASGFIFMAYGLIRNIEARLFVLLISAVLLRHSYFALFPCGAILAECARLMHGSDRVARARKKLRPAVYLTLIVAIFFGSFPSSGYQPALIAPFHDWLMGSRNSQMWHMLGAVLLVASIDQLPASRIHGLLTNSISSFLGKVSFSLYLVHIPLLCSLTMGLIVLGVSSSYYLNAALAALVTLAVAFALSYWASINIEHPTLKFSRKLAATVDRQFPDSLAASLSNLKRCFAKLRPVLWAICSHKLFSWISKRHRFAFTVVAFRLSELLGWFCFATLGLRGIYAKGNPSSIASPWLIRRFPRQVVFVSYRINNHRGIMNPPMPVLSASANFSVLENQALGLYCNGRFHLAREAMACAAELSPLSAWEANALGALHLLDENEQAAVQWLKQAAAMEDYYAMPYRVSNEEKHPPYAFTEHDLIFGDDRLLYDAYNQIGQRVLHVGAGQYRPQLHRKAMEIQTRLRALANKPNEVVARYLAERGIHIKNLRVLPIEWCTQIGHIGMLDVLMRMRQLGWWSGDVVVLAPANLLANAAFMELLEAHWGFHVVKDDVDSELHMGFLDLIRSHGINYFAGKLNDGTVVPWHEAGAIAIREWESKGLKHTLFDTYDKITSSNEQLTSQVRLAFEEWGLPANAPYVCLHIRESSYYGADREKEGSGQSNRNADIANYLDAINYLTAQGYWVLKMGSKSSPPVPEMDHVIDYARSDFKSPEMDIYLIRHAKFLLGTTSGLLNVAVSFDMPVAAVNCLTTESQLWHSKVRFTPKLIVSDEVGVLTWEQLTGPRWRWGLFTVETMRDYGLSAVENTSDEIRETTREVHLTVEDRLDTFTAQESANLIAWTKSISPLHNYGSGQIAHQFLDKHKRMLTN
jgi:putative glycosyltransferase (TIGR04372 family)